MATKIYIGNLSFSTTEEKLQETFSQYGEIISTTIITDKITGASKGFGFVEMENEKDALGAIHGLKGANLEGRRIRVNLATEKKEN